MATVRNHRSAHPRDGSRSIGNSCFLEPFPLYSPIEPQYYVRMTWGDLETWWAIRSTQVLCAKTLQLYDVTDSPHLNISELQLAGPTLYPSHGTLLKYEHKVLDRLHSYADSRAQRRRTARSAATDHSDSWAPRNPPCMRASLHSNLTIDR